LPKLGLRDVLFLTGILAVLGASFIYSGCGKGLDMTSFYSIIPGQPYSKPYLFLLSENNIQIIRREIFDSNGDLSPPYTYSLSPFEASMYSSSLVADPMGHYLFYSTGSSKTIRSLRIDAYDGHISGPMDLRSITYPPIQYSLVMHPALPCGYVGENDWQHPFAVFCFDSFTGSFNYWDESIRTMGANGPLSTPIGIHPTGKQLYFGLGGALGRLPLNADGKSFGTWTQMNSVNAMAISVSPDGAWMHYTSGPANLDRFSLNSSDGGHISGSSASVTTVVWTVSHPWSNTLYALTPTAIVVYDNALGTLKQNLTISGWETTPKTMVLSPSGKWLYVSGQNGNQILRFAVDPNNQTLTYLGSVVESAGTAPNIMVSVNVQADW
jgi:hypothetical protein